MEREQSLKFMHDLLRALIARKGSDLFITAGFPPAIKVDGKISPVSQQSLSPIHSQELARSIMTDKQAAEFEATNECNFAISPTGIGRFRVNAFVQQGRVGLVLRTITTTIPKFDELGLPQVLKDVAMTKRGLVIFVGGTGSGKSTSLASMIGHRNDNSYGHIITIEDPVEYVHEHKNCIITQREVGVDTDNWFAALKNTLRQAPDVILIGEIRDAETMESAIAFAETGHLCVSTLHANNANQALERILNFFPPLRQHEIRLQLSLNVRAIISQRLIAGVGGGRAAALEIMLDTPRIRDLVKRGETEAVKDAMEQGHHEGCQTFDSALFDLVVANKIDDAEALKAADSPNNLRMRLDRLRQSGGATEIEVEKQLRLAPVLPMVRPGTPVNAVQAAVNAANRTAASKSAPPSNGTTIRR